MPEARRNAPPLARLVGVYENEDAAGARDGTLVIMASVGIGGAPRIRLSAEDSLALARSILDRAGAAEALSCVSSDA